MKYRSSILKYEHEEALDPPIFLFYVLPLQFFFLDEIESNYVVDCRLDTVEKKYTIL